MASQLASNPALFKIALQAYAIKKSLSNFGKPALIKDDDGQSKVAGEDTDEAVAAASPSVVHILAGIASISGGVTMFFYTTLVLDFAALCLLVMAPVVAIQKFKLQSLGDLRGQHNALREKCNTLARENDKLTNSINDMEGQMDR